MLYKNLAPGLRVVVIRSAKLELELALVAFKIVRSKDKAVNAIS